jgi:hypothetical protein
VKAFRYQPDVKVIWDNFVTESKNGTFLFQRNYMDYHADRFLDNSLLFYDEKEILIGILPASLHESTVISHGGLTYGGVVCDTSMKAGAMLALFDLLLETLRKSGVKRLIYKPVPHIYHSCPAEEDLYALFRVGAVMYRRDLSTAIDCRFPVKRSGNRLRGVKRAIKSGITVSNSTDFVTFFSFHDDLLQSKYGVRPAHKHEEMAYLAGLFPDRIKFRVAMLKERMLAGVIIYDCDTCAHFQYISCTDEGKESGALDLLLNTLIDDYLPCKRFVNFGVSTENNGSHLNAGLAHQKEQFGGRAVVHDFYGIDL